MGYGDFLALVSEMVRKRSKDTTRVAKVKGHAAEGMVRFGQVSEDDCFGNKKADEPAELGRRSVDPMVIDSRRNLSCDCGRWYLVMLLLHRLFIAIARTVVNHHGVGGTESDAVEWSAGSFPEKRRNMQAVRDFAITCTWTCAYLGFLVGGVRPDVISVVAWPFSVSLLVKMCAFLGTLHWPAGVGDLICGDVSCVELLTGK